MFKLFNMRKQQKIQIMGDIFEGVDEHLQEIEPEVDENLPQVKLFISVEQLSALDKKDEDRFMHAKMFLRPIEKEPVDTAVYEEFIKKFDKSFSKLGNDQKKCPHCSRLYSTMPNEVKKCIDCGGAFYKTKRPQDGKTVLVREEDRKFMDLQWENIRKAELIEGVQLEKLEKLRLKLEQKHAKRYTLYDAHYFVARKYIANAVTSGRFRLYASLMYYLAEQDRYRQEFAKALTHYFYIYFLHYNGASNSVVFGDKVRTNIRIIKRIHSLLKMAKLKTSDCEALFTYSIKELSAFEIEEMPHSIEETYVHLVKSFDKAEGRA